MAEVDWHAVPGPAGWYDPDTVGPALRDLAAATSVREASSPSSVLFNSGVLHEHSGTLYPAAAYAAPALLDIVEHGHPVVRVIAADLLTYAMEFGPSSDYPLADGVSVCCAVAAHVRARRAALTQWPELRREADRHRPPDSCPVT
ncbi:hypothetical protein M8542_29460 [Amycolatopsis sp. OK19-0408]|uniref:Uncharacterized protein n=1 Tax=Amycolatopsis iheyensis TaxID=2945988 RepID=A0A9X2NHT0_9PSEU|nr:hypothetical protein [Amycolatopsis iheyensis]MCR6486964.1 hypothetical protein [Amycolatopsis iheyensis]